MIRLLQFILLLLATSPAFASIPQFGRSLSYDEENRLKTVIVTNLTANTLNKSEFVYDALGRRRISREYTRSISIPFITSVSLSSSLRSNYTGFVGMKFTVGNSPLVVRELGRWIVAGNSSNHVVKLASVATGADIASVTINAADAFPGQFAYMPLVTPITLSANTSYYLVSQEVDGGDSWYDYSSILSHGSYASIVTGAFNGGSPPYNLHGSADNGYGPVNFRFDVGSAWVQTGETRYLYDGQLVIQERDGNNNPTVTYTRGLDISGSRSGAGGIGGLLARTSYGAGGITAYYHSDLGGNITAMADANGLVAKYLYDPFGGNISATGTLAEANKYRFSGKEIHSPTGLYHYGFRDYDPGLQRWLTPDAIGELGGLNLYQPFFNAPTTFVDRNGLDNIHVTPENIAALSIQNAPVNGTFTATAVFKKVYTPSIPSYQNPGTFPDYQRASTHYEFTGQYQYSSEFQPADPIGPILYEVMQQAPYLALSEGLGLAAKGIGSCFKAAEKTVDLYRAVGVREFESVMANKAFQAGGNSMSARQFGFTMEETLKFADADPSKVAILKATVPESILPKLDFSKTIDPFIFKNGVITVHPEMQPLFNQSLKAVEHVY